MTLSSDLPLAAPKVVAPPAPRLEAGEAPESRPDNESVEAAPAKSSLQSYQGTRIDLTA